MKIWSKFKFKLPEWKNFSIQIQNLNNYHLCDSLIDAKTNWLSRNHLNYNGSLKVTGFVAKKIGSRLISNENWNAGVDKRWVVKEKQFVL